MAYDFSLLESIEVNDLNLFDAQFQLEQLLDDVSYFESSFSFLNVANSYQNQQINYQTPIRHPQHEWYPSPTSSYSNNVDTEPTSEEDMKTECTDDSVKTRKKVTNFDKPPEPYADMISKAIMSTGDNSMQLKDIYNFMIENYESFTSKVETSKWKSAIRHNLSSHNFFIKTSKKNAQGHYWSIESNYLHIIKEKGTTVGIKKCLNRKTKETKSKSKKQKDVDEYSEVNYIPNLPQSPEVNENIDYSHNNMGYNDSAFFSSNDNDNSQLSFSSSSCNSSMYTYKFLANSPTNNYQQQSPIMYYTLDSNVNYVNLVNQELSY